MRDHRKSRLFVIVLLAISLIAPRIPQVQASPGGMEQVIFGGYSTFLRTDVTAYAPLVGGYTWQTIAEHYYYRVVSTDGVIKNLRFVLRGSPGAGNKYTFTLMLNGVPSSLEIEISDLDSSGSNMVDEVIVTGGDYVTIRCIPDSSPNPRIARWSSIFEGDTPNESLILGGTYNTPSKTVIEYAQVMGSVSVWNPDEDRFRQVIPTSGVIKDFYVKLQIDPGTGDDAYRYTMRLNGETVAQSLIVTITADDTTGSDLVHELEVVAGDVLTMMCEPLNTPTGSVYSHWGMTFVSDINGESIVMSGSIDDLPAETTEYQWLTSYEGNAWDATELNRYQLGQECTLKKLNILLSGSPGAGNKYDFTLRIAVADSNVVATVSGTDTTGDSGALEDNVALDDYVTLQVDPDSTPTIRDAYWGFVCYIPPTPPIYPPSDPDLLFGAGFNATSPYVELHWNHSLVDVQFFEVQNSSDAESWTYLGQSTTANYTDTQVVNGTERYYKVRACRDTGVGWKNSSFTSSNFETVYFIPGVGDDAAPPINYPAIDEIEFNTTVAEEVCGVSGEFSDVEGLSGYIFWENATSPPGGANSSWTSLTGTSDSALENITLPSDGAKLGVKYYVNDTDGNWGVDTLVIFPLAAETGDTYVTGSVGIFLMAFIILLPVIFYAVKKK